MAEVSDTTLWRGGERTLIEDRSIQTHDETRSVAPDQPTAPADGVSLTVQWGRYADP